MRNFRTPAARYPADPRVVFILVLCVANGIPLAFKGATPGTIAAQLDPPLVVIWGILLTFGALTTLVGTLKQNVNGVIYEQIGSVAVGGAAVMYGGAIFASLQWRGSTPALFVLGFGLACFWRWGQLQRFLRNAERAAGEAKEVGNEPPDAAA